MRWETHRAQVTRCENRRRVLAAEIALDDSRRSLLVWLPSACSTFALFYVKNNSGYLRAVLRVR